MKTGSEEARRAVADRPGTREQQREREGGRETSHTHTHTLTHTHTHTHTRTADSADTGRSCPQHFWAVEEFQCS